MTNLYSPGSRDSSCDTGLLTWRKRTKKSTLVSRAKLDFYASCCSGLGAPHPEVTWVVADVSTNPAVEEITYLWNYYFCIKLQLICLQQDDVSMWMAKVPKWQLKLHLEQRDNRGPLGMSSEPMETDPSLPVADKLNYNYASWFQRRSIWMEVESFPDIKNTHFLFAF